MSERTDSGEWHTTTDHDRIEEWAAARDAVPVLHDRRETEPGVRLAGHTDDVNDERVSWERFFELFEERNKAFRYREREPGTEAEDEYGLIDRSDAPIESGDPTRAERGAAESADDESSDDVPSVPRTAESGPDQIATSDTGDREPVAYEQSESEPADADAGPTETPASESARGSVERGHAIVLDEIHEHPLGPDRWREGDEYVVFENVSGEPVDLSGWVVENEADRTYRFEEGTTLEPGAKLTLHSGDGEDTETKRHWGADEPIWGTAGDTVVLRTPDGQRVLKESYKGGGA